MIPFELSTEESALVRGGFFRRSRENKGKTNMKQLKFMLAAAAAFGIATAQADTQLEKTEISSEDFEGEITLNDTAAVLALDGFSYEGATASDNESVVVAGGANSTANALQVNTGTDPLLRKIDTDSNNAVALDATKKVYIDTMVQFTVTPEGDTVTAGDNDKLMIYLKEVPAVKAEDGTVTTPASAKLMVKAGRAVVDDVLGEIVDVEPDDFEVTAENLEVVAGQWYNLKVNAVNENGLAVFTIFVDDKQLKANVALLPNDVDGYKFPSMVGLYNEQSNPTATTLDFVGFAGEGKVDELVFSKDVEQETSVDFTFAWSSDGISAVKYAIGDATEYTLLGENKTIAGLDPEATIKILIEPADWYAVKEGADLEYTASEKSADLDDFVVAVTTKEDGDNVVVKPNTSATEVGITAPVFADADATQLGNVLTWAKKGSVTIEQINSMSFTTTGDPAGATPEAKVVEEAYLLGCSPTEVEAEKKAFVFPSFAPDMTPAQMKAAIEADKSYNGTVVIEGATTLSDENGKPNWATGHDKPAFYRARLIFE